MNNPGTGAAYVFANAGATWQEQAKLVGRDLASGHRFGASVAIDDNLAVVGAPFNNQAFGFRRSSGAWGLDATFVAWDGNHPQFGHAVAVSQETVVVTGPHAEAPGTPDSGAAYVFRFASGGWLREAKVLPDLPISFSQFGSSISLQENRLAVGAFEEKVLCPPFVCYPGAAYVFERTGTTWQQLTRLVVSDTFDRGHNAEFGRSIAIAADYVLVGAPLDDEPTCPDPGWNTGAAFAFRKVGETWSDPVRLSSSNPVQYASFGFAVAATASGFVLGAYTDDFGGNDTGAVYAYRIYVDCNGNGTPDELDADCNANETPDDCDIRDGASIDCNHNDVPDECDLAIGSSDDCNGNDMPDECDTLFAVFESASLSPIGAGAPQQFLIPSPPPAGSDVRLSFLARGDFGSPAEAIDVQVNGVPVGTVFAVSGNDCPSSPDSEDLIVPRADFNAAIGVGDAIVRMVGTASVDAQPTACASSIAVTVGYQAIIEGDCNGNGIPDFCDVADHGSNDCNENGVPDECDLTSSQSIDCNRNGAPDECDVANGQSEDCNDNDSPDECDFDVAGDLDANGDVDAVDTGVLASCLTGPDDGIESKRPSACCNHADLDADNDIDLDDVARIQNAQMP